MLGLGTGAPPGSRFALEQEMIEEDLKKESGGVSASLKLLML